VLVEQVRPGTVFYDLRENIGLFSILASRISQKPNRVTRRRLIYSSTRIDCDRIGRVELRSDRQRLRERPTIELSSQDD